MTDKTKEQVMIALEAYMDENGFSAAQFASRAQIPANYISYMRRGKYAVPVEDKEVHIDDRYFRMIADIIGMDITGSKEYWKFQQTPQALQMIATLEDAKKFGYTNIIIGETGSGKSYVSDIFIRQNPKDNFKITVGSMDNISDLLDKLCEALKIPQAHSKSRKISAIIKELQRLRHQGRHPIVIFDEAEYMKQATLCNVKELHDHLNKKCGIVLIGTDQLDEKLLKMKKMNRAGMPQFYRRVKYGIRRLKSIDTRYREFLEGITDKSLRAFLQRECDNYGELHDVLVPAMREADRTGEALTENFVRKVLNMPAI